MSTVPLRDDWTRAAPRQRRSGHSLLAPLLLALAIPLHVLPGQTDYFNLDDDRPIAIEDAVPVERYALELQLAPARVERETTGSTVWSIAPELAYGVLPRTDLSLDVPLRWVRRDEPRDDVAGLGGIEIALFHNLNTETRSLPAMAVSGGLRLPVGGLAGESTLATVKAIASRSFTGVRRGTRIHANAAYTLGDESDSGEGAEASRWRAGVAADRTFVFQSFLIAANVFAERPLADGAATRWVAGAGVRYQLSLRTAVDAGFERRIGDEGPEWAFTFGTASAFSLPFLIPGGRSK